MAEEEQYNQEYEFSGLDDINPETLEENQTFEDMTQSSGTNVLTGPNIKRNALIVIGVVFLIMILYKFLTPLFTAKKAVVDKTPKPIPVKVVPKPKPIISQPVKPLQPPPQPETNLSKQISALEVSQQSVRSDINSIASQLNGMNSNIGEIATQISQLNQSILALSAKLDSQSHEIDQLLARTRPTPVKRVARKPVIVKKYFVQAIIPGRAWLIATNGTTLTVREGTIIPGYGTVKLIDPNQGKVMTSSGQVIGFSQTDS